MSKLDLPKEAVKKSVDALEMEVRLQNYCASEFPYCCTGEITVSPDGASCECGLSMFLVDLEPLKLNEQTR